jgi:Fur family peroxide stress response transcriptional regulator
MVEAEVNRNTRQKEVIIKILKGTNCHPDADWIYRQVRKEIPHISLGTVYRNLKMLNQSGLIREVGVRGETNHFDGNTEPHYHFRCRECGRIFDLDAEIDKALEKRVADRTGFKITEHHLEFGGLCPDCQ